MRLCSIEGCDEKHYGKNLCKQHYLKQYKRSEASLSKKRESLKRWRESNKEHIKSYEARYREANKEHCSILRSQYYLKNKAKEQEQNKRWHKINRSKAVEKSNKYRSSKLRALPNWLNKEELLPIYELAATNNLHVDHIVPLQGKEVCGLHVPWNLRIIPATDNFKKKNKLTKEGEQLAWTPKL